MCICVESLREQVAARFARMKKLYTRLASTRARGQWLTKPDILQMHGRARALMCGIVATRRYVRRTPAFFLMLKSGAARLLPSTSLSFRRRCRVRARRAAMAAPLRRGRALHRLLHKALFSPRLLYRRGVAAHPGRSECAASAHHACTSRPL